MRIKLGRGKRKKEKKKGNEVFELIPFKCMDENNVVKKDGTYLAFLKIKTKNINSLSSGEQFVAMNQLELLLRVYDGDFSVVSMMFPSNVDENRRHWQKKYYAARKEGDAEKMKICKEHFNRLKWVEGNLTNLEFYIQVYGGTKKELNDSKRLLKRLGGSTLGLMDISPEETKKIIYKLMNLNTEI